MGLFGRRKNRDAAAPQGPDEGHRTDLVVPLLAGAAWMAANSERFALIPGFPESAVPHARPLADGLWATYASDASGAWEVVQRGQVDELGGAARLHALALENLRRRVADDIAVGGGGTRYAFEVASERDLTASLALIPDLRRQVVEIPGRLAFAVPTRVNLFVCGADDADTLPSLRELAPALFDRADGKPVAPTLFALEGDRIEALR